jgi:hypothetical protein
MSSPEEHSSNSEKSVHKTKKVACYCSKCKGKHVDSRTQQDHMGLPDIGRSNISTKQSSSKRKFEEELLPEFSKNDSSESEGSETEDTENEHSNNNSSENNGSENDGSYNDSENNLMESNGSEREDSTTSDEDEEYNTESSTESINLFLEDDFAKQSPISRRLAKGKFIEPLPADDDDNDEEMIIDQPLERSSPFDVYQPSDDDKIMVIINKDPDGSPS